jgi:hypothetical protein
MTYDAPAVADSYVLERDEARQPWNWLLRRQGLAENTKFDSVLKIAHSTLGLHAVRLPSPFATVIARSMSPTVALTLFETEIHADLMTVRCMRKTLHTLPLELAAIAHSATRHFRERDALRAISNANVPVRHISDAVDAIVELLSQEGLMSHRAIEARLMTPRTSAAVVRLALKLVWEQGVLTYRNDTTCWNRENRAFELAARLYPCLDMSMDRDKAVGDLIREYFDRYGPASLRDAMWWSGLSRSAITTAMNESARHFVTVQTPWCQSLLYMYDDRYNQFRDTMRQAYSPALNFLAHEDAALKAYSESRDRYLGTLTSGCAFNQIWEVLPTIIHDGQIVGTWAWDGNRLAVTYSIMHEASSPKLNKEVRRRAGTLSETLRLRWGQTKNRACQLLFPGASPI